MALIANNIILPNQELIRRVDLSNPDKQKIANVLDEALKRNYKESSVEWVTSHPNLDQPHFNLASSGICGNTALLDFGDMSYGNLPLPRVYNFREVLRDIGRDNNDSFIFGNGIYQCPKGFKLREIVLNTLFPSTNEEIESKNRSRVILLDSSRQCKPKKLNLHELGCTVQGTYFLCNGSTINASVLKVCANGPLWFDHYDNLESKRFIKSMQEALEERFGSRHFVALGGVYTVNRKSNIPWKHKVIFNDWEDKATNNHYCKINAPETIVTTFNSSTELHPINLEHPIKLNSCQSIHSLSHHSASVNFSVIRELNLEVEYVGYFCPATTLYRIGEPPQ